MPKSKRTRGATNRRRDADAALVSLEGPDEGVRTRSGAVVAPPETSHGRVSGRAPSPAPGGSHPSPPATVETDEKRTRSPSSPGPAAEATAAASPPERHATPSSCDTTKRVDRRPDRGQDSRSRETDAPASPTHQTLARDAPAFDGSAKTRTVRFSRHVHGFRFTKAERGLLVSVFERFNGKTPSRDVCDDIARAFTRSPVRDPTRRALAPGPDDERAKGAAPPVAAAREDFAGSSSAPATASPSRVLLPDPAEPLRSAAPAESADGLPLASSPFRGAAWRDAARARARLSARGREDGEPRGSFGGSFGGGEAGALDPPVSDPPTRAEAHPDEGLAFFAPAEAPEEVWADAVADATGESADGSSRGDETKSLLYEYIVAERRGGASRTPSRLDAFVGSASRLERLERALDVAAWQPVGTSLYVGERAETATPPRTRRVSSPSPPPPPADPAPAAPYLPETPGVLASEDNGVERIASERRGASFFPRPEPDDETLNPAWSGSERGAGESFASGAAGAARDEAPEFGGGALSTSFRGAARGAVVDDDRARLGFAGLPLAAALAPSPAYAPGVSLEDLVREKEDDLSAALALGARTGRWLPLAAAGGGGPEPGTAAPSSAAQAAMVASAAEELGDGEAHPVTWKQIKTWFENRRMTQKRIKEGIARPPRRNNNAHPAPEPEPDATDAAVAKGEANRRGKPPRVPASKPRATPAEKLFAKASASRSAKSPEPAFVATARGADAARDPPPARRSLDETRRDAAARPGAKRARTDANASKTSLGLPARRSLDLDRASLDAAAAAAAAAEDLHACDTAWGEPSSALTREMSWADIHEALAGAERARRSAP